jgi:hypothetical protein
MMQMLERKGLQMVNELGETGDPQPCLCSCLRYRLLKIQADETREEGSTSWPLLGTNGNHIP